MDLHIDCRISILLKTSQTYNELLSNNGTHVHHSAFYTARDYFLLDHGAAKASNPPCGREHDIPFFLQVRIEFEHWYEACLTDLRLPQGRTPALPLTKVSRSGDCSIKVFFCIPLCLIIIRVFVQFSISVNYEGNFIVRSGIDFLGDPDTDQSCTNNTAQRKKKGLK